MSHTSIAVFNGAIAMVIPTQNPAEHLCPVRQLLSLTHTDPSGTLHVLLGPSHTWFPGQFEFVVHALPVLGPLGYISTNIIIKKKNNSTIATITSVKADTASIDNFINRIENARITKLYVQEMVTRSTRI